MTAVKDANSDLELVALTPLPPDPMRAERTRGRCRAALSRGVHRPMRRAELRARAKAAVAPVIVAVCCTLYTFVFFANTLRVEGLL